MNSNWMMEEKMIRFIKGELEETTDNTVILENNGIGFEIFVPENVMAQMPQIGSEVKIHTYFHVREDAMQLFGFLTKSDLRMFELLITVNGIGPKGALGILSIFSADELRMSIFAGDAKTISKAPGIGKKTAEKLILELKDKIKFEDSIQSYANLSSKTDKDIQTMARADAIEALVALGYSQTESVKAVQGVVFENNMDSETVLKEALKKML